MSMDIYLKNISREDLEWRAAEINCWELGGEHAVHLIAQILLPVVQLNMQISQRNVVFDDARDVEITRHVKGADLQGAQVVHPGEGTVLDGGQLGQVADVQLTETGRCGQTAISDQTQRVVGQPQGAQLR